ncbi:MAG: UDP-N-acetylmuramoyl-tripeptide--D-alanyl-D-alanine ligase [Oscillospiraceae bacterium]|nr:UDP-N-acetylmuramoyl-tripeptide--D-alanyl-D-alanine ligase [Oscillospiraceae bacterium]
MSWTLQQLSDWCGGTLVGNGDTEISCVVTDSRKIVKDCLFLALHGANFNGNDFAAQAVKEGAAAVLVDETVDVSAPTITVADTRKALGLLAAGYRQTLDAQVVGVTGSVGKTTTKEMIAALLAAKYQTAKTAENFNNDIGMPMTILSMPADTQMAVLEMGMNHFGEMAYLASIARPDVAVITNIGTMHIEYLGSREGILKAKMEIMQGMQKKGVAVFNGDEPLLWNLKDAEPHKKYYYGVENPACDVLAENVEQLDGGMLFVVKGLGHRFELYIPADGMHLVYDALAAITVALLAGVAPEKIQIAMSNFRNTGMRQRVFEENGFTIIEDCYNAGPESMAAALQVLGDRKQSGKRIAVLGDMLELGARSSAEHFRIGRLAARLADTVYAYGAYSDRVVGGAITGGMDQKNCADFTTHEDLVKKLAAVAQKGDVLLFKGSRAMKMENALRLFLEKTKEDDRK